jgi:DNA polymerase I
MSKSLYLLDGHSLAHRAFYALPLLRNSGGEYTNAIFGFARMLFRLIDDENPNLMVVAFDKKGPTFRHKEYEEYKAQRKKMPDELTPQIPLIKKLLKTLRIPILEIDGFEADDVIGTLACRGEEEGYEVRIVTGDRDAFQLVSDKINVLYTRKGITEIDRYDLDKVRERYELEPEKLIDMKGLMGDSSDNIPGVPGIGEKTAISLLKEFDTLENVLENIEKISGKKRQENLREYADQARLSRLLARIITDVPFELDFSDCEMEEPAEEEIMDFLKRLEFTSLLDRFRKEEKIGAGDINIKEIEEEGIPVLLDKIEQKKEVAFDLLLDDYLRPVSAEIKKLIIAIDPDDIYSISLNNSKKSLLDYFRSIFNNEGIKKYILHAKETMTVLKREGFVLKGLVFDPLLASYLLHPSDNLPSFEEQLKKELNLKLPADISAEKKAAFLTASLYTIKDLLVEKLKKFDLLNLYKEIEIPLIEVLVEMGLNGIKVDKDYLEKLSRQWESELTVITEEIYSLCGEEFNINSPKQLGEILFEKLGLPVVKKTKTGYSTGIEVLEELMERHEVIPLIMQYRQLMKLKSTYVDALPPLINPETGRIHTSFNQMVTATGRLSSTDPNLQNIPVRTEEGREIRKAFIPGDSEQVLVAADYSQIELRVLAHISGDENLISAFNRGEDIHTQTACEIFQVKPDEVTADMRRHAKVINFGIAYGMSSYGLARDLKISRKDAEEYINRYFSRFSGVKEYMQKIVEEAKEKGYVTTIYQRRRYIPEIRSRNYHLRSFAGRTAINTPIQGSAADIMKIAMIKVYNRLEKERLPGRILLQVHDELVLEVKREELPEVVSLVREEMEQAVELKVPLIADIQVGNNWRDKEKYHA